MSGLKVRYTTITLLILVIVLIFHTVGIAESKINEKLSNPDDHSCMTTAELSVPDHHFSGWGKDYTDMFALKDGLVVIETTHNGSSNFIVWLLDHNGEKEDLVTNVIGSHYGQKAFNISGGNYLFDISADGNWDIKVYQPKLTQTFSTPLTVRGTGESVTGFIELEGLTTFDMQHSGSRNFIVWLLDRNGNYVDLLANHIGPYSGRKAIGVDRGIYIIDIYADGNWRIDINGPGNDYYVAVSANPESGGMVSGGGLYYEHEVASVTATPHANFEFINWTEGGNQISTELEYSFTVSSNRDLVANFRPLESLRLAGGCRYETAVKISEQGWPGGAGTVLLSRGDDYPDSLAGVPLAFEMDAPILLTRTGELDIHTKNEIARLNANRVIILGGSAAVSEAVETELIGMGKTVERLGGKDRYQTAKIIAQELAGNNVFDKAFIATGADFPDALAAASYAAAEGVPILLTRTDSIPESTAAAISGLGIESTVVVGGTSAVSDYVYSELPGPTRIAGQNRWETALKLAGEYLPANADQIFIATGRNFPDALAGGVLAAKNNSGVLLVPGEASSLPDSIEQFIVTRNISEGTVFGGSSAVSYGIEADLIGLLP